MKVGSKNLGLEAGFEGEQHWECGGVMKVAGQKIYQFLWVLEEIMFEADAIEVLPAVGYKNQGFAETVHLIGLSDQALSSGAVISGSPFITFSGRNGLKIAKVAGADFLATLCLKDGGNLRGLNFGEDESLLEGEE